MNKQSIRSFGIATFLIGAIMYSLNMLSIPLPGVAASNETPTKQVSALEKELETTKQQLEEAKKQTATAQAEVDKLLAAQKEVAEEQKPAEITLKIYRGITGYDISRELEAAGIIEDALEFELFLVNEGYSKRIQIGDFTIDETMTEKEIAELITKQQ